MTARRRRSTTDPRRLQGSFAGPGGPHDRDAILVDSRNALLADGLHVATIDDDELVAMIVSGRINHTPDRCDVMVIFDADGMAAVVTELLALMSRTGDPRAVEARRLVQHRFAALDQAGDWGPR